MNIQIPFHTFHFEIIAQEPLILPSYKGSTLRGGFGNAFRRVVCALKKNDCSECILKEKCVYSYVFETPPPSDTKIMRKYTSAPLEGNVGPFMPLINAGEVLHVGKGTSFGLGKYGIE